MTMPEPFGTRDDAGLAALPVYDARPQRVEALRTRCLAALAHTRQRQASGRRAAEAWRSWTEAALAGGLAALFLAAAVERVFQILR